MSRGADLCSRCLVRKIGPLYGLIRSRKKTPCSRFQVACGRVGAIPFARLLAGLKLAGLRPAKCPAESPAKKTLHGEPRKKEPAVSFEVYAAASFVFRLSSFVFRLVSFVFCLLSFVFCLLSFVFRLSTCTRKRRA